MPTPGTPGIPGTISPRRTTRLAPSPTGALHLGNARTFMINWAMARQNNWRIVLRIEDLDGPRVKAGACEQAVEDLAWLGMDWDAGPYFQREDLGPYQQALETLSRKRLIYPCTCTRQEIERAQSAPHGEEHDLRYPGTCRIKVGSGFRVQSSGKDSTNGDAVREPRTLNPEPHAWRVIAPSAPVSFVDGIHGPQQIDVDWQVGDFVVATKAGLPAYQLAVVVDDARQGVTDVIRGDDLLSSTGRQLWLYCQLELTPLPNYWHVPLVLGPDGRRLAKRHGDTRVAWYREQGVSAERIIGLLAVWCGIQSVREPMAARVFAERFIITKISREPVTFTQEDHQWLLASKK